MIQKVFRINVLLPYIEDSYRNEYTEYTRLNLRFSDAGAASEGGEKCEREIFYDIYNSVDKSLLSSGSLVLFDDGRLHEQDIRRRLRLILQSPERELLDKELTVNERPARGKIDNTARLSSIKESLFLNEAILAQLAAAGVKPEDLDDPILEIKSVNQYQFEDMAETGLIKQTYYDQVQMYLHASGKKWALILIKNRNSAGPEKGAMPFLEFVILPDPERIQQIRDGLLATAKFINGKEAPPRPFLKESTNCSYCRHKYTCWGADFGKKAEVPMLDTEQAVEAPDKEILEGAIRRMVQINAAMKELETEAEQIKPMISRYFKATKQLEIIVGDIKTKYVVGSSTWLDEEFLRSTLKPDQYMAVSEPSRKLLEAAIENRKIDAKVLEDALRSKPSYQVRFYIIKPPKESERQGVPAAPKPPKVPKEKKPKSVKKGAKK
ncbi:MAG: hypothetical protein WC554_12495 [Clostridia bacterium]